MVSISTVNAQPVPPISTTPQAAPIAAPAPTEVAEAAKTAAPPVASNAGQSTTSTYTALAAVSTSNIRGVNLSTTV